MIKIQYICSMKIKDLLYNRDKLRRYDELKALLDYFKSFNPELTCDFQSDGKDVIKGLSFYPISVCISALEAEIAKLEEE